MTHTYHIRGLTCNGCVAKAKSELLKLGDITEAQVQLAAPQATLVMQKHIPVSQLQNALHKAGHYTISEADGGMHHPKSAAAEEKSWLATYKPLLILFTYIVTISVIAGYRASGFDAVTGMRTFMSAFFFSFSFFKMINLDGFADSYSMYDIVAKRFRGWAYLYAFIELMLGVLYAINFMPILTNIITVVVLSVSITGVLQSVLNKRQIQCACLGAVFNLPMSTVTIVEDALMIVMGAVALVQLV